MRAREFTEPQAAGCVLRAVDTGRWCLQQRSDSVSDPGVWSTWGGGREPGETLEQCVRRELAEEGGYTGPLRLEPLSMNSRYATYIGHVPHEFEPDINNEVKNWRWVEAGDWPKPMHPGVAAAFKNTSLSETNLPSIHEKYVFRVDGQQIPDFEKNLKTYYHNKDFSMSGADDWSGSTGKIQGVYAGTRFFTAPYTTGAASGAGATRYVAKYGPGQPIIYFDRKDIPKIKGKRSWLTVFDGSKFKKLPTGEYFSSNPGQPLKQIEITDPFQWMRDSGWEFKIVDDLPAVLKQLKNEKAKYGAEGMPMQENFADGQSKKITFKTQKGNNKFATTMMVNDAPVGVYQYNADTGRSIAEVYPEYKGQGLGKLLVLNAIYTAAKLGLDFVEDESRTAEYDNVLDSLSSNGYIVDDDGYWYVTQAGEQFLNTTLKQGIAEGLLNETSSDEAWELVGQPVPEIQQFVKQMGYGNDEQSVAKITSIIDRIPSTQIPAASIPKLKNLANKGTDSQTLKAIQQISGRPDAEQQYIKLMQARDAGEGRNRDITGYIQYVKSGKYDPPVLLKLPTGIYVVGGRTRLYAALALGVPAIVKIISANNFKQAVGENFADGKKPGRKGLSRRVGIPKKPSLGQLEKIAKSSTGERRRMAQWQLNMRRGKARKNK